MLLNTVELWVSRRLRQESFPRYPRFPRLAVALVATAVVVLAILRFTGAFSSAGVPSAARPAVSAHPTVPGASPRPVPPGQSAAVAWISGQVSSAAIIGCYPAMCTSLQTEGISASRLVPLGPELAGVLKADVIATLPSADQRLVDQYAPGLIASFGTGDLRIEIRAVARGGAAAYQSALRADLSARRSAGSQLLRNPRIKFSATDAARLAAGVVDSRLLATLAALSSQFRLRVTTFGDSSPGAPLLLREVTVASDGGGNGAARLAAALAMVNQQGIPYLPARSAIIRPRTGQALLRIEFAAPSPLGLLTAVLTAQVQRGNPSHG